MNGARFCKFCFEHHEEDLSTGPPVLAVQVGGDHYKKYKIQPVEYIHANGLDFFQGAVVKYITRFRDVGGAKDLRKAKHFIEILLQLEYGETGESTLQGGAEKVS